MNANKNGRLNQAHEIPTFTVAPVTRAVRAALAISLTLLALGGSSAAFAAGTCAPAALATTSCDGAFNVTAGHLDVTPIDDLAVVQDHLVPHSVTPATGLMGIDAHWGGNASATHADITTVSADELFAHSLTVATASSAHGTITHAPMSRARSLGTEAYGDVSYINNGPISVYGPGAYDVTAVYSNSAAGSDTVDNQSAGTINAVAQDGNAIAVNSSGYVNATVTNEGAITSSSVNGVAVGVIAQGYTGNASVTNSGSITATSTNYQAVGILASSADGYASVTNSGSVTANGGQDQAVGIEAFGQTGSSVSNTGSVTTTSATGTAIGLLAQTVNGNATVSNTYNVTVGSSYNAVGLSAISANGDASASSTGHVQAIGHAGLTSGIEAYAAVGNANASNSGYVVSGSYGGSASGVSASSGNGSATASNASGGYVRVVALTGDATGNVNGISAKTYNGDATASNDGKLVAYSTLGEAIGINVSAEGGNATATNTGNLTAYNGLFNKVRGIQAISSTGEATVTNSGEILAVSHQVLGYPFAVTTVDGIGAQGYIGSTTVTNSGYIKAVGPWFVNGEEGISVYGSVAVTNTSTGKITTTGLQPTGISASADYGAGQAVVNNAGSIIANQEGDCHCGGNGLTQYGTGIYAFSDFASGVQVTNSGSISVNTQHGGWGILAHTYNNVASVTNIGSIALATTGYGAQNFGISASSAYGNTSVVNSGDITITTGAIPNVYHPENIAIGIFAETGRHHDVGFGAGYYGAGNTSVTNTGNINIVNAVEGYGIHAVAEYGSALVSNSGHITINDSLSGWGIFAQTEAYSGTAGTGAVIDNSGAITITAAADARGIDAQSINTSGATITNTGDIAVNAAGGDAYGAFVRNYTYGDTSKLTVNNSGTISASNVAGSTYFNGTFRGAQADGIRMFSYGNDNIVNNSGSITAAMSESFAAGSAIGILVKNGYGSHYGAISITNSGSIAASALSNNSTSSFHEYYARGAFAGGVVVAATYGDVAVANAGSITATAKGAYNAGAGLTTADGISVISKVGNSATNSFNLGDITLTNVANGSIAASVESTEGTGAAVANSIAGVVSFGSQGAYLVSHGDGITVNNAGLLSATALVDATAQGSASAFGISAINGSPAGFVNVRNTGTIYATAT
ncbi:hypothetical protein, partial [Dyella sp. S184]|uniref:beta strand repeat-containing protein n=1 Tax=Dyella sp. S184 TaxID=1641862 RepID=UPI001C208741